MLSESEIRRTSMKTTIQRTLVALAALAGMCAPGIGLAQAGSAESRIGHWYIGGGFGVYSEEDNAQLANQDAGAAVYFSGGYRASPNIAIEADALLWNQDFTAPATIPNAQGRADLVSTGVSAVIKLIAPLGAVDLYAGGGLGFYATNLNVEVGSGAEIDETETDLGYQLLAGADIYVSRKLSVGLEYRWLDLGTSFNPYVTGEIDAGGQFFLMNVRGHF
jgi:opacity protein-like surface antigen